MANFKSTTTIKVKFNVGMQEYQVIKVVTKEFGPDHTDVVGSAKKKKRAEGIANELREAN